MKDIPKITMKTSLDEFLKELKNHCYMKESRMEWTIIFVSSDKYNFAQAIPYAFREDGSFESITLTPYLSFENLLENFQDLMSTDNKFRSISVHWPEEPDPDAYNNKEDEETQPSDYPPTYNMMSYTDYASLQWPSNKSKKSKEE